MEEELEVEILQIHQDNKISKKENKNLKKQIVQKNKVKKKEIMI